MAQVNINIRIDEDLKREFEAFCGDVGMNMTTAFCIFAKTAVRERKIPFEISAGQVEPSNVKSKKDEYYEKKLKEQAEFSPMQELLEDMYWGT